MPVKTEQIIFRDSLDLNSFSIGNNGVVSVRTNAGRWGLQRIQGKIVDNAEDTLQRGHISLRHGSGILHFEFKVDSVGERIPLARVAPKPNGTVQRFTHIIATQLYDGSAVYWDSADQVLYGHILTKNVNYIVNMPIVYAN